MSLWVIPFPSCNAVSSVWFFSKYLYPLHMQTGHAAAPDMMGAVGCMGVEIDCKTYVEVTA